MSRQQRFTFKGKEYTIDQALAYSLDTLVYNVSDDMDFVILITGDRTVRIGKSVLGLAVCAYLASRLAQRKKAGKVLNSDAYDEKNIFFDNKEMIKEAQLREPYSVLHYDEGREGLAASKAMQQVQQDLIDFFTECGQLNHIFVIVCPDFFELKEMMAVPRSEYLINVFRREISKELDIYGTGEKRPLVKFQRGHFEFFGRKRKAWLYDEARRKQRKSYQLAKPIFFGSFSNQYPIDEEVYRQMKADSLARFTERHREAKKTKENLFRDNYIVAKRGLSIPYKEICANLFEYGIDVSEDAAKKAYQVRKTEMEAYKATGDVSNGTSESYINNPRTPPSLMGKQ